MHRQWRPIVRVWFVAASIAIPSMNIALAQELQNKTVAVRPVELYKPTAMPDRIVLTWADDPRTSQAVTWRTHADTTNAIAELTVADPGPYFSESAKQFKAETTKLVTDLNEAHFHSVSFTGLTPATRYAYRVGDGTNWSEWFHFSTASDKPESFSFVYFGDAQNNIRSMWSRVIREAYRDAPKAKFMIHAGDLINNAESDAEWGEWFGAGSWLNAMVPSVPIPGNHEQAKREGGKSQLSHHWRPQFTLFENGPQTLPESCFTFEYQNVRIIGLNSNEQIDVQTPWLEKVLAENNSQWVVCTFHHPIFSTGKDRDNPTLRAAWKPLFDKYRVDLVLQGHDHTYGRTGLSVPSDPHSKPKEVANASQTVTGSKKDASSEGQSQNLLVSNANVGLNISENETGTVYVVSVSGPKMYNNTRYDFMKRLAEDTQLYQIIHVDGDRLKYESRTATGQLYDAFELKKQPGQVNELTELDPEVAERLRPIAK